MTSTEILNVRGYNTQLNIGASIHVTAILARSTLHLTDKTALPSRPAIAANYKGIPLIEHLRTVRNSQAGLQRTILYHRAAIFVSRRPYRSAFWDAFNCVLHPSDTTGHFPPSRALTEMIRGLVLHDAWKQNPARPT